MDAVEIAREKALVEANRLLRPLALTCHLLAPQALNKKEKTNLYSNDVVNAVRRAILDYLLRRFPQVLEPDDVATLFGYDRAPKSLCEGKREPWLMDLILQAEKRGELA